MILRDANRSAAYELGEDICGLATTPARIRRAALPALVNALEQDIADGHLSDGDRLPPHRELAKRLSLSVGTVAKAYQEAEQRGIISGRVGQGTLFVAVP
ncbi:hypothetical protein T190_12195 [Sinorhizobium meliloti CCBAU 01290]|nr:hypothetical protein T190_12195 [Sinorhizobium meliloti CCBAU 01290]